MAHNPHKRTVNIGDEVNGRIIIARFHVQYRHAPVYVFKCPLCESEVQDSYSAFKNKNKCCRCSPENKERLAKVALEYAVQATEPKKNNKLGIRHICKTTYKAKNGTRHECYVLQMTYKGKRIVIHRSPCTPRNLKYLLDVRDSYKETFQDQFNKGE